MLIDQNCGMENNFIKGSTNFELSITEDES